MTPLPPVRVPHPHVEVSDTVYSGSPVIAGTKVPVRRLWAWYRGGTTIETPVRRYPNLGPAKVMDALAFAFDNLELIQADLDREQHLFDRRGKE